MPLSPPDERPDLRVWAKCESHNPGGSSKDRSAEGMVADAWDAGEIGPGSTVIESTSGNLGVGLALACRRRGLELICVVDSRTDEAKIKKMRDLGAAVRIVTEPDPETGDLLVARLALVRELVASIPGAWWPDQYSNPSNPQAHRTTMAEIDDALGGSLDWLFVAVSTTGTLRGCCDLLAERRRTTRVVAVDAVGSVLFGGVRGERRLPGLGAGKVTELSRRAWYDRLIRVSELDCVAGCRRLLARDGIHAGASSGGVLSALGALAPRLGPASRCAMILADGGEGYASTVYDDGWAERELGIAPPVLRAMSAGRPAATAS